MLYKSFMRPLLMSMDPETAHELAVKAIVNPLLKPGFTLNQSMNSCSYPDLATQFCGIPLENPIGLAAGFDKNAIMYPNLHQLGFSFVEVGTITAKAQAGNEKPRLFRLPKDQALINRMGFNNHGADAISERLAKHKAKVPLGGNIGKSKVTPIEDAVSDYEYSFNKIKDHVNYFVVNVSSPNTPNLRSLQAREPLTQLLSHLSNLNKDPKHPLLLKIAPDLNDHQLEDIVRVVEECKLDGVIATNTTIERSGLATSASEVENIGAGGLSGPPVKKRSTEVIRFLRKNLPQEIDIIGVGGIVNGDDAYEKIRAGACALQIYTGLIYRGPNTVFGILKELNQRIKQEGFTELIQAIGTDL